MPARLHPGVYVEEVPSGAIAIEAAGTSTAIFVGETERGPLAPTSIKGVADYNRSFGGYKRHTTAVPSINTTQVTLRYAIQAFFNNGGTSAYVLRAVFAKAAVGKRSVGPGCGFQASSPGAWANYVSVVFAPSSDYVPPSPPSRFRIFVLYQAPGSASKVIVERWDRLSFDPTDENYAPDVLARSAYIAWDSALPLPQPATAIPLADGGLTASPTDTQVVGAVGLTTALSGGAGGLNDFPLDDANANADDYPTLLSLLDQIDDASLLVIPARIYDLDHINAPPSAPTVVRTQAALDYVANRPRQDLFCIGDLPRDTSPTPTAATQNVAHKWFGALTPTDFGAVYFPWVQISDPVGSGRDPTVVIPPSGLVAGIYARTDQRRGVWKAPAGLEATLLNARMLDYKLLDAHQDDLNPIGVNALRVVPAGGNVVWASRTMRPSSEWRYIPVRRMAIFLRTSIYNGIQWAVFEPNDATLWTALRLSISAFMEQLFRQGAFAGATAKEAFFVKCDAETTPPSDQIAGIVEVWVGFAPLRPAEFVVVKLSQIVNQTA
jgi:uncharacterized protein